MIIVFPYQTHLLFRIKKEGKDQESIQSSTAPDPAYQLESDKFTIRQNKRGPRGHSIPNIFFFVEGDKVI